MVALAGLLTGGLVVAVGATPAGAKTTGAKTTGAKAARHRAVPRKAFTLPAENSTAKSLCEPTTAKPCPRTNTVWSGYVLTPVAGRRFTSVSASWIQTSATCPETNAWALFWVGLDGWSSFDAQTVEQGGTSAECDAPGSNIPVSYEAWWEMYPTNDVQLAYPIAVGDQMNTSVVFSATAETYTITVDDITSGQSLVAVSNLESAATNPDTYTVTLDGVTTGPTPYAPSSVCSVGTPCQNTSAEFVVEAPGGNTGAPGSVYPLAHFRLFTFTASNAVDSLGNTGPITSSAWASYSRVDLTTMSGTYLASATGVKKSGTRFRDAWDPPPTTTGY